MPGGAKVLYVHTYNPNRIFNTSLLVRSASYYSIYIFHTVFYLLLYRALRSIRTAYSPSSHKQIYIFNPFSYTNNMKLFYYHHFDSCFCPLAMLLSFFYRIMLFGNEMYTRMNDVTIIV